MKKKAKWFKDGPDGVQLHAGTFRGRAVWHSDDGGKTWWCGNIFSHSVAVTRHELIEMAVGIIRDTPNATAHVRGRSEAEGT